MRRLPLLLVLVSLTAGLAAWPRPLRSRPAAGGDFVHFESAHVHPLALTPSGDFLLAVNTPDHRLVGFDLRGGLPSRAFEIPVGLEPVSVAVLDDSTAWVVNQLSDDVSVVNLNTRHVRATVRVGDEPADVVFAGAPLRAYVSVSQEDRVKVFDPATLAPAAAPIPIPGRMPRALARDAAGTRVWVAVLNAGNRSSVLSFNEALNALPPPNPPMSGTLPPAPDVGLIVQQQGPYWRDESGAVWNAKIPYSMLDTDLAAIHTATNAVVRVAGDIGAVNFGLAVNPVSGAIAVTATEARNLTRFENHLSGHAVETRVAYVDPVAGQAVGDLNPHVNYAVTPGPPAEADSALGIPNGIAWAADGSRAYVTSLASDRLGVLSAGSPAVVARVPVVAGPSAVLADGARGRVYVLGRFRNQLQTLDAGTLGSLAIAPLGFDPTPDAIVNGRRFFYGGFTSGHGEQACASCHVFGDFDNLAWDLGDPTGAYLPPPPGQITTPLLEGFHPMKGPMVTQSLRGLPGTGILHWRGDRLNLAAFNGAFVSLMGRATPLPDSQMAAFSEFVSALVYPPNPHQHLDRAFPDAPPGSPSARRGELAFFNAPLDGGAPCNVCHAAGGFGPGTNGIVFPDNVLLEDQDMKVPQLRNLYKKTGFDDAPGALNKRGFGFTHDGAFDDLMDFLRLPVFTFAGGDPQRRDVEAFMMAFDTGIAPAVGYQLTFRGPDNDDPLAIARLDTLRRAVDVQGHIDLVAHGRVGGVPRGWVYTGADRWQPDVSEASSITSAQLRALGGPGSEVTVMGVPRGSGDRMGNDRDRDTWPNGDERLAGSDPGDPASTPANVSVPRGGDAFAFRSIGPNPFRTSAEIRFVLGRASGVECGVFDLLGRRVATLARGERFEAGTQSLRWEGRTDEGREAAAGVYFVRLVTAGGSWNRTIVRVK